MNKDNTKLPNGWIFVPGLVFAVLLLFYVGSMSNDWFNPRGRGLLAIALILAVPSVVGLISRICRWQVTRLLAVGTVGLYWVGVGLLAIESFRGIYGLLFFGPLLVALLLVAIVTTGLLGYRMGRGWAFAAVGGLFLGMIATSNSIQRARTRTNGTEQIPSVCLGIWSSSISAPTSLLRSTLRPDTRSHWSNSAPTAADAFPRI